MRREAPAPRGWLEEGTGLAFRSSLARDAAVLGSRHQNHPEKRSRRSSTGLGLPAEPAKAEKGGFANGAPRPAPVRGHL